MREDGDLTPIGPEVEKQLELARTTGGLPEDDTEDVPFNPANQTGLADREVVIHDHKLRIRDTGDFQPRFGVFVKPELRSEATRRSLELDEQVYADTFEEAHFGQVVPALGQVYPKLYAKLLEIVQSTYAAKDALNEAAEKFGKDSPQYSEVRERYSRTLEDEELNNYYFSKAFDAYADIAARMGLPVDLAAICAPAHA